MLRDVRRAVTDERVLAAMRDVRREAFVPERVRRHAYDDAALPLEAGQTISQPLIVGIMSEALDLRGEERVLEIGTGSGYQAAVLARLAREVVTVEVVDALREHATATLADEAVRNVRCVAAGATTGAPRYAPFDAIIVTAAAPSVPQALIDQLADGGRIVIPLGTRREQELTVVTKRGECLQSSPRGRCRFVPLVGDDGFAPRAPSRTARD